MGNLIRRSQRDSNHGEDHDNQSDTRASDHGKVVSRVLRAHVHNILPTLPQIRRYNTHRYLGISQHLFNVSLIE